MSDEEKIILVAKMYTGEYIEENTGHEIINFFKPDNGKCFYGYIIYNGKVKKCNKIDTILLVSGVKNRKIEILAKIDKPEFISDEKNTEEKQEKYIKAKNIRYGGVLLNKIMKENGLDEYGIYITYKAENITKPNDKQFILLKDSNEKAKENEIKLSSWTIGHNLGYLSNTKYEEDYNKLYKKIQDIKWDNVESKMITEQIINEYPCINEKDTFMDLINKKYDETIFSNMLYYYFKCFKKKEMFKDFAKKILEINLSNDIKIYKEKPTYSDSRIGRIDIFIEDSTNKICIVIENKLKSGINGRYYSQDSKTNGKIEESQLHKYKKWVEKEFKEYEKKFFIFVPNYKENELKKNIEANNLMPKDEENSDLYKIITYKEIYDYFNDEELKKIMQADKYYEDFVNALSYHIYTADKNMERKFVDAIRKARNK